MGAEVVALVLPVLGTLAIGALLWRLLATVGGICHSCGAGHGLHARNCKCGPPP